MLKGFLEKDIYAKTRKMTRRIGRVGRKAFGIIPGKSQACAKKQGWNFEGYIWAAEG